jgi:hypothetical protein
VYYVEIIYLERHTDFESPCPSYANDLITTSFVDARTTALLPVYRIPSDFAIDTRISETLKESVALPRQRSTPVCRDADGSS